MFADHVLDFEREFVREALKSPNLFTHPGRFIAGVVTTDGRNRNGKIIHPLGCKTKPPCPLLLNHNWMRPLGEVIELKATHTTLTFVARVGNRALPQVDCFWAAIKAGELIEVSPLAQNSYQTDVLCDWTLEEVSICETGSAANRDALIEIVKEIAYPSAIYVAHERPEIIYRDVRDASRARLNKRVVGV